MPGRGPLEAPPDRGIVLTPVHFLQNALHRRDPEIDSAPRPRLRATIGTGGVMQIPERSLLSERVTRRDLLRMGGWAAAGLAAAPLLAACGNGTGAATTLAGVAGPTEELTGPINILAWDGYDNPDVVQGFTAKYGVEVNIKIHSGNAQGAATVEAEPGRWDVINVDNDWIQRLARQQLIQPLNRSDYPALDEMWEPFRDFPPHKLDGTLYGVPTRFGINGIIYWPDMVDVSRVNDAEYLWDPSLAGSISMVDWFDLYILLVALYGGNREPWTATGAELEQVTQRLIDLKPNILAIHGNLGDVGADLVQKNVAVAWGSSSSDLTIGLGQDGVPVELSIPDQGAALWTEGLGIVADTEHAASARAYLQYMTSAEVLAKMAWNDQFKIEVTNAKVVDYLSDEQVEALKLDQAADWFNNPNIVLSQTPVDLDGWEAAWERFKSA
jgi:spermidine/putrescine-binding protein